MISSSPKLIAVTLPVAVEGIFATNLSVKTSHKSWYYKTKSKGLSMSMDEKNKRMSN